MIKFKRGDEVLLNSKNDFSQDQAKRDWTNACTADGVKKINAVSQWRRMANVQQMRVNDNSGGMNHACNRFALVERG